MTLMIGKMRGANKEKNVRERFESSNGGLTIIQPHINETTITLALVQESILSRTEDTNE